MGLRINQNIAAQNAYRSLTVSDNQMSKSLEKLSSGSRINRAADDAAGLAISEGLRSQVGGLKVASRNAQDGVSVVQTAEGALNEVHSILQRMRDLGVQAANDSNGAAARGNITTEVTSLTSELTRISSTTNFNGKKLIDGTAGTMNFQVGADGTSSSQIGVVLGSVNVGAVATALTAGSGNTYAAITPTAVTGNLVFSATSAGGTVTSATVAVGAAGTLHTTDDVASKLNADSTFGASFSASVDSNDQLVVRSKTGAVMDTATAPGTGVAAGTLISGALDFSTSTGAQAAITAIDTQIGVVSDARASLGAYQNRLEHSINNTNVAVENLSASESRIRDTDMAQEMMSYTRSQILSQAGTAMLAQANQSQQGVLSLLRG
ncbi:MAG: flagellin [Actinoplanes sp.]|jgi:flagellin|nr:flagellin [Actinoplanes sp.]